MTVLTATGRMRSVRCRSRRGRYSSAQERTKWHNRQIGRATTIQEARYVRGMPTQLWRPDQPDILDVLQTAEPEEWSLLAAGSNYVYLLKMQHRSAGEGYAVYKPQ